ncbi:MAG: carbon-nitrogen hydrolase family protein [Sphingomicrobium sp.]
MTRIALFQSNTGIEPVANARALVAAIGQADEGGAEMLFTPEMSGLLDRDSKRAAASLRSEDDDGVLAACRDAARSHGLWVHIGSLAVRSAEGKLANRAFLIDPAGKVRARYDKIHLFDVDLPTGESWRESAVYNPGDNAVVIDGTPVGRLGLTICYDLRFPELFSRLSEGGAQTIAVPAAFTVPTGRAHWDVLLRARAIEAGAFVVAAAQSGRHADGRETYGHSLVVSPWGEVLLDMGQATGVGFADIELSLVDEVRQRIPALAHRRPIAAATVVQ